MCRPQDIQLIDLAWTRCPNSDSECGALDLPSGRLSRAWRQPLRIIDALDHEPGRKDHRHGEDWASQGAAPDLVYTCEIAEPTVVELRLEGRCHIERRWLGRSEERRVGEE